MEGAIVIRRVDDLGRILIPSEIRKKAKISAGSIMEISANGGEIVLRKHNMDNEMLDAINMISDTIDFYVGELEEGKASAVRRHIDEIKELLKQGEEERWG